MRTLAGTAIAVGILICVVSRTPAAGDVALGLTLSGSVKAGPAGEAGAAWAARGAGRGDLEGREVPVWVFFADKGLEDADAERRAVAAARAGLSERCLRRRAKVRGGAPVDLLDVPVFSPYIEQVLSLGAHHRTTSRWLNAISVEASPSQVSAIRALDCVVKVQPVARGRREPSPEIPVQPGAGRPGRYDLDYGECLSQLEPIQVPLLHDLGISGQSVLVCMLDTGFLRIHDALAGVNVIAEWDFINGDPLTADEAGDPEGQHNHGTYTLSVIGGYDPGSLIGPAYGAQFALAKTEDTSDEYPAEEDYWVAGIEWADTLGSDVVSSSLSYMQWYTYEDMNGDSAVTTQAADLAVYNGMVVCNSAGNYAVHDWHYIAAPADGDSVLAIGAVDSLGEIAYFSSRGPTSDGRTKPDLVAMGVLALTAMADDPHGYSRKDGTSFSCPLAAGVAALLLESHPDWTPMEVARALKMTALNAEAPDTVYGWGLIQAFDANAYDPRSDVAGGPPSATISGCEVSCYPNPCWGRSTLSLTLPGGEVAPVSLGIYDVRGRPVRHLVESRSLDEGELSISWDGRDETGREAAPGVYYARLRVGRAEARSPIVLLR